MMRERLQAAILRAASLLAPGEHRSEWLEEWQSELWYVPRHGATRFCLGAFRDAIWLRRNSPPPHRVFLRSPIACLALLAALAGVSVVLAVTLPAARTMTSAPSLAVREVPTACVEMLLLSGLLLGVTRLTMGRAPAKPRPMPWTGKLRRGVFLALKIALVQPILLGGFILVNYSRTIPLLPMGLGVYWIVVNRWVLADQRRRCPVCLKLLTDPVRIGTPSGTFLDWYGAESLCADGHGLQHAPEISASYCDVERWLCLDSR
jgi:hypothetical protein